MTETADLLRAERAAAAALLDTQLLDLAGMVQASEVSNADDEHDPEGATIGFERAQLSATIELSRQRIADLDRAIEQLAGGTYGRCEACGRAIGAERLAARPSARTCITCAT